MKIRKVIEVIDPSFEADAKEALKEFNDNEMRKRMLERLTIVKRSNNWSDLADYYIALQYIYNIVDTDLSWGFNQRIGAEMMVAFAMVGNTYATRFMKYNHDAMWRESSQFVDDKR